MTRHSHEELLPKQNVVANETQASTMRGSEEAAMTTPNAIPIVCNSALRSLLVLSASFFFLFTAWHASQNLQTSLPLGSDVSGSVALAITYGAIMVSSLFGPFITSMVGARRTMLTSIVTAVIYFVADGHSHWWTLYPAALLFGIWAAPLWVAQGDYITWPVLRYAHSTGREPAECSGLFNGIFLAIFQLTQALGNATSGIVLSFGSGVALLYIILIAFAIASAVLVVTCLEDLPQKYDEGEVTEWDEEHVEREVAAQHPPVVEHLGNPYRGMGTHVKPPTGDGSVVVPDVQLTASDRAAVFQKLFGVFSILRRRQMLCLVPIMVANGMLRAFIFGDFTKTIGDATKKSDIAFVMALFGLTDACASLFLGRLSDMIGRSPVLVFGTLMHAACLGTLQWVDLGKASWHYFAIAAVWGIADGSWYTMVPAHLSARFLHEAPAAFATKTLWEAAAATVMFAIGDNISMHDKSIVLFCIMLLALLGYFESSRGHKKQCQDAST